ncbi:DUF1570 domain-containing protein [Gilvimarinus polysaccharolyticus]|uniref:DUF1570 domain-containing protein n=1 Tax=Gilvimarinus polysaccharolyticus TaxID=863921 RepID=UPI000673B3D4|nr:DUF1570 domain-containing protein [Gilvimarinus polysaccharolyticus]
MIKQGITALLAIATFSLAMTVSAGEVDVKKLSKTKWLKLETANFSVITDANEKKARQMVDELERFRHFMALLLGYTQKDSSIKTPVILAKKKSTLRAMGIPRDYAGVFIKRSDEEYAIFANARRFSSASSGKSNWGRLVVLHELVHLLINNSSLNLASPPWYNEGIAEYFGTYMEKRGNIVLGDVSLLKNRFRSMIDNMGRAESVDTEALFKTKQEALGITDERSRDQHEFSAKFYARSFAVVHYLNSDTKLNDKLFRYLHLINKGYSVDETFKHVFEMEFSEMDKLVDDYINSRYVMGRVFPMDVEGGIKFPEFHHTIVSIDQREATEFLVSKIAMFSESFLGEGNREKMLTDIKTIYPDVNQQ